MANNLDVLDAAAATQTLKTTDTAGVHTPHHNVDSSALPAGAATSAKQDTQITAEQAILAKLLAAPATEAKQDTQITAEQAILATAGATNGAAVITDANGTLQQYLRGLVKLWITGGLVVDTELAAAAALADAAANPTTPMIGADLLGYNGATWDRVRVQNIRKDLSAVTITTITTVWTPASGKKFRLMGGSISVSAACNVLFEDNSAGAGNFVWRTPKLVADTPYNFDLGNGKLSATVDQVLKATSSAAATITGTLYGVEE